MKGFALTVDVTVGAILAIFILTISLSFMHLSYSAGTGDVSMKRLASDVIFMLDYNGTLDSLDSESIISGINHLLSPSFEMGMNITVYDKDSGHLQDIPINYATNKDRFGGKHSFITFDGNRAKGFAVVDYWVAIR